MQKSVIIEFDFAVMNGAGILFETTRSYLENLDKIPLDAPTEARYLAGRSAFDGLTTYFNVVKTKKTAAKATGEIEEHFRAALEAAMPNAVTDDFRAYVKALVAKDIKVVIVTHASVATVASCFEGLLEDDKVMLYHEAGFEYGFLPWDSWRRVCSDLKLPRPAAFTVTGSGYSVKSSVISGFGSLAVVNKHVAYQDFLGASDIVETLNADAAERTLAIMHL